MLRVLEPYGGTMQTQVLGVLAVAAVGVATVVYLTLAQLRRRQGDDSHQRRGIGILLILLLVLFVLEGGLRGTSFKPEPVSFVIHMVFALPTGVILCVIAWTGFKGRKGSVVALKFHRLLNKPAGSGAMLWLSSSIFTGLVFVAISLVSSRI